MGLKTGIPAIDDSKDDYIVGSDECGYGAWAGPLVVCAVVVSRDWPLAHTVKDSKAFKGKTAEKKRAEVAKQLIANVIYSLVSISVEDIDKNGVYDMLLSAHSRAITQVIEKHAALGCFGSYLTIVDGSMAVDYNIGPDRRRALDLPQGDALVPAVSAASIIGKAARDAHMKKLAEKYPGYGFEHHKGYGTAAHEEALRTRGICEIHRKSYSPIARIMAEKSQTSELWASFEDDD